ncbi:MAG: M56 family metallopeptidase [Streptosporangiaceae bacterium]
MTAAVLFALYAGAAGVLAPSALRRRWVLRSPRLAIAVWLVLLVSWVTAVVVAVLAAAAPFPLSWPGPGPGRGRVLAGPPVPGGKLIALAGLALAAAVVLRAGWCLVGQVHSRWRGSREQAALIAATGRPGPAQDTVILDHEAPAVYCLTYGRNRIVVSAGALAALTPRQVWAVLAHERAHLRCRHHAMLIFATGLARAFPAVPLLAQAEGQLRVLAEMAADDTAVRGHRRDDLAAALVILAGAGPRPAALTAGGPAAMVRLERLLAAPEQRRTWAAGLAAIAALLPPTAVACVPLVVSLCDLVTHPG